MATRLLVMIVALVYCDIYDVPSITVLKALHVYATFRLPFAGTIICNLSLQSYTGYTSESCTVEYCSLYSPRMPELWMCSRAKSMAGTPGEELYPKRP